MPTWHHRNRLPHFFVTVILLGVGWLPRVVLCVAPGHCVIEMAESTCCRPISATGTMMFGQDGGSCAGDCVDTPLGADVATPVRDDAHQIVPAQLAVLAPSINVPLLDLGGCRIPAQPPRASELSPRYLRTTVNLC